MPHDNDTGGFFVAVITKFGPLPWQKDENEGLLLFYWAILSLGLSDGTNTKTGGNYSESMLSLDIKTCLLNADWKFKKLKKILINLILTLTI